MRVVSDFRPIGCGSDSHLMMVRQQLTNPARSPTTSAKLTYITILIDFAMIIIK